MAAFPTPEREGHYWAKLRLADNPDDNSRDWEVVQVNYNIQPPWCEADIESGECMSALVPGLVDCHWMDEFVWGPPVPKPAVLGGKGKEPPERAALRKLLKLFEDYQGSDLSHYSAHNTLVRYGIWAEAKAALAGSGEAIAAPVSQQPREEPK